MDIQTISRMLTNSGFTVKGADATSLIIEDPSCILRNFETFLEYAWVIITLITAILLFGWAISKIRGANTDIATNIRNLVIMFGVLSVAGPIVNLIYGDDLMARTCHEIKIPLADVQKILDARNSQLSPNDSLFEGIDIFDSGVRNNDQNISDLSPIDVPDVQFQTDPNTGEIVPIYDDTDNATQNAPGATDTTQDTPEQITPPFQNNSDAPISARVVSTMVIEYIRPNGSRYRHNDGTAAWRHNNPGNIVNSSAANRYGAIGNGRRFAIFPSESVGMQAIVSLLRSSSYRNLSIINAIKRYAPASDRNNPTQYAQTIHQQTGLDVNRTIGSLNDTEIQRVANVIKQVEGWTPGTVTQVQE